MQKTPLIILLGNPRSTGAMYFHHGHRAFIKKDYKELKDSYSLQARTQWKENPTEDLLEIGIKLFFGDKRKRDWDNFHKLSMDALTGIVWVDDSQIKKATVELFFDKNNPRIELKILKYEPSTKISKDEME